VRVLVCVKRVPLPGGTIVLTADGQEIETQHLGFTIGPHEECAVEEAVQLVEAHGGESVVLTLGPPEAEEQLRECMAVGVGSGILLATDGREWDAMGTAAAIVDVVRDEGPFDLLLFGHDSADTGNYQVGVRVGHALGLPVVVGVKRIEPVDDGQLRCERDVGGARDVYEVLTPAVVTVLEGLNLPRYPSVPGRLRAKSKPLAVREPLRQEPRLEKLRLLLPTGPGKQVEILGDGKQAAERVVEIMRQIGAV